MGAYWQFVCVQHGRVALRVNPQRCLGGMKWGEYIGTTCGLRMLNFLQENFCATDGVWGIASDSGAHNFRRGVAVPDNVYALADELEDISCHPLFRKMAVEARLTNPKLLDMCDRITAMIVESHTRREGAHELRPFSPPDLYRIVPQFRRRRLWAILLAASVLARTLHCVRQSTKGTPQDRAKKRRVATC